MREKANINGLADITAIAVDKDLPQSARVTEFKKQIKDTANYLCEGFIIHAQYTTNGDKLEDCLRGAAAL
jgi:hypothetical protein